LLCLQITCVGPVLASVITPTPHRCSCSCFSFRRRFVFEKDEESINLRIYCEEEN
jgi:hypothetical protein